MEYTSRSLRRRGNTDKWEVTLSYKDPMTGEAKSSYHTVTGKTKKQAERAREKLIVELEVKGGASDSRATVATLLADYMRYKEASGTVEASTIKGYHRLERVLDRYIGGKRLSELTIGDIEEMMAKMVKDGYAAKSVTKYFRLLKQALHYACAHEYIARNPCDFCKPPKVAKPKINALCRDDRTRMLRLAYGSETTPLGMAIELGLTTGMRRSEICALRWDDLNEDGTITVRRSIGYGEGGAYVKETKTGKERAIPLTQHTYAVLSAKKKGSYDVLRRFGVKGRVVMYILGEQVPNGSFYAPTQLTKDFRAFCQTNGFECTFNDLRHTFATMMIGQGVDVRTVASYLGHANVAMTLNTYADVDPEAKRAAVGSVAESFDVDMTAPKEYLPNNADAEIQDDQAAVEAVASMFTVGQLEALLKLAKSKGGAA